MLRSSLCPVRVGWIVILAAAGCAATASAQGYRLSDLPAMPTAGMSAAGMSAAGGEQVLSDDPVVYGVGPAYGQAPTLCLDGSCGVTGGYCGGCPACAPCADRFWFQSNYLFWWTKGNRLPALVTTSPEGTDRDEAGVLGLEDTSVLFGDERVDGNLRHGVRYRLGGWLDPFQSLGVEGHYFYLDDGNNTGDYSSESQGDPILARPFFNTELDAEDALLIAFPDVVEGTIDIRTSSEMHSAGLLLRQALRRGPWSQMDLLAGYRFFRYREGMTIHDQLLVLDVNGFPRNTRVDLRDTFVTENDFHGGEIGLNSTLFYRGLVLDVVGKVALGNVRQQVRVAGQTQTILPNGDENTVEGGLLALPTNIGERSRNRFAFLPELNVNLRYPLTHRLDLTAGYTLLYLTRVVRTGDQIDTVINPSQLIQNGGELEGPERPEQRFHDTAIWAQGLHVGVNWTY